ncbi:alpha/beta fold hydrolase [Bacillus sp. 165]|uniref:alpha/beta fold hydrolase n=1 Tax=Bacillus sp. 165 TaxID=1529117 RepID=UPI001ADC2C03|nr:alpha/beta fold hydrolase [Bacillus sp. 165]MBO9130759.1 alpha/beta fold hydrolase [Bacillus sp. 165]
MEKHAPSSELEQEYTRWKNFFNALTPLDPSIKEGVTLRQWIWKKNKATVWYYPAVQKKYTVPLFLVYSLVNQPFILDLEKGSSMIEAFVNSGYDVYLLDFGIPGYEDKDISIDNYIFDYIQQAVKRVLRHSNAQEITIIGYCVGGTLATIYTALAEEPIKNLILSVSPIDVSVVPILDKWAQALREGNIDFEPIIDAYGIIPASFMKSGLRFVSSPIYFTPYLSLLNRAYDEQYVERWRRFKYWVDGHIPFTGAAMKQLLNDIGKDNKLIKNEMVIRDQIVDLANIQANLLVLCANGDRLVPKELSSSLIDAVSSEDKTYHIITGGHAINAANGNLPDYLNDWLSSRSGLINDLNEK